MGVLLELTDILVLLMEQLQKFSDNETVVAAASGLIEVLTAAGTNCIKIYRLLPGMCVCVCMCDSCQHNKLLVVITTSLNFIQQSILRRENCKED